MDLDAIWRTLADSRYLRDLGCVQRPAAAERTLILHNAPGIVDGLALTTAPETWEDGIPDLEGRLRFATYGEPVFDALLTHLNSFGLPPAVRRIVAEDRELNVDRVGYAVACRNARGVAEIRLVTSLREVAELAIAEDAALSDAEIEPVREQLARLARQELDPTRAAADLKAVNREAGHSQLLLNWLVAQSLLRFRLQTGDPQERFWPALARLESLAAERGLIRLRPIPVAAARRLTGLLFEPELPTVGTAGYIDAPEALLQAALAAAARVADSLHVARGQLTLETVLKRLEREIDQGLRVCPVTPRAGKIK